MSLSLLPKQHLEAVGIDTENVGPLLTAGAQSLVYKMQREGSEPEVLKQPIGQVCRDIISRLKTAIAGVDLNRAQSDYSLCEKYFGHYVLPTEFHTDAKRELFVLRQPFLDFGKLKPSLVSRKGHIRDQMVDILDRNRDLMDETGKYLDVTGLNFTNIALLRPYIDNIVIDRTTKDEDLKIIDTGLLDCRNHCLQYAGQNLDLFFFGLRLNGRNEE